MRLLLFTILIFLARSGDGRTIDPSYPQDLDSLRQLGFCASMGNGDEKQCDPYWGRVVESGTAKQHRIWDNCLAANCSGACQICLQQAGYFDDANIQWSMGKTPKLLLDSLLRNNTTGNFSEACSQARFILQNNPDDATAGPIAKTACQWKPKPKSKQSVETETEPKKEPNEASGSGKGPAGGQFASQIPQMGLGYKTPAPASKAAPGDLNETVRRIGELKADGNYGEVIVQSNAALLALPGNADLLNAKALAQNRTKDYKGALETADRAINASTGSAAAYANKAFALGALGDRKGMIEALRTAAELDPQYEAALHKAVEAGAAGLFDMPGEVVESRLQGSKAKEGAGLNPEMVKWIVIAAIGLPLMGLIVFFILRNTVLKTPPPKPATPWPTGNSERLQGKYELGPQIGAGGMGMVFEGRDLSLDRKVAIKRMLPQLAAQPKLRERFLAEAKTVAALHHPNIVDIHAIVEEGADLYLIFEHVKGRTLADALFARGKLPFSEAVNIIRDIASALDFAHGSGIMHRDLKPGNVMMTDAGRVIVLDFGLARAAQDLMTQAAYTNTIVGTPAYMAPEQENGMVCKQSDVYSLAVCLYEMLSGKRPFGGAPGAMMVSKLGMAFEPISKAVSGLPGGLDAFFVRALAADPAKRFPSPKEFIAAIDAITPVPSSL